MVMERRRDISPPLPPDPASSLSQHASAAPSVQRSRDSVAGDASSQVSTSSSRRSHPRSRAASDARPIIHQDEPQPIREAVDRAFGLSIDQSPAASQQLDPAFIAQVTEAVVKNLVSANIGTASSSQSSTQYPPAPPSSSGQSAAFEATPQSPVASDSSLPFGRSPPSPRQDRSKLRDSVQSVSGEGFPIESRAAERDAGSQRARVDEDDGGSGDDLSIPDSKPINDSRRSSRYATSNDGSTYSSLRRSPENVGRPTVSQQAAQAASSNAVEPTALEKAWQPLFDKDNKPTSRFSQFLRGIALHLINDYEPKSTLVVTPAKLLRFLEENRVANELYPWRTMFAGSVSCGSISTIYRRLLCQHHFIQTTLHEPPNLPGLTPQGFEAFMTCLIQAHPDHEYERLSQAVMHMPISNADSPKERFPKELPRRLLPAKANAQVEQRLIASMAHEPQIKLKSSTAMPPPPPQAYSSGQQGPLPERQRMPYSRASHSNVFDDEDLVAPSAPKERERKPYVAREGGSKVHRGSEADRQSAQYRSDDPLPPRIPRQNSTSSAYPHSGNTPPEQRASRRTRLNTGPGSQPPLSYTDPNTGRNGGRRSPPLPAYARSDVGSYDTGPASHSHRMSEPNIDVNRRWNPRHTAASIAGLDDDPRGRPIPMREPHAPTGFDQGYPPPPPLSSSLPRQRQPPAYSQSFEDRRNSTYAASTNVPDGWASSADHPANYPSQRSGPNGMSASAMNH